MTDMQMKNEKGFTLLEMLVAMAISSIILASTVYVFTKQDSVLRDENSNVQLRNFARLAMDELTPNIRLAGYGFPPGNSSIGRPALGITVADATTLTYRANADDISTFANADSTASTDNFIFVGNTTGFTSGLNQNVVFFNLNDPSQWNFYTLISVNPNTSLTWDVGNPNGFDIQTATTGVPVMINQYHIITYNYDAGNQIITVTDDNGTDDFGVDDTTTTIANNISDLTFSYFDANGNALSVLPLNAADRGDLRKIQISLTLADSLESSMTTSLQTNVYLRNMGT
jgi:prepilin-type N-terminal cleavage/methylation domain-containing protein